MADVWVQKGVGPNEVVIRKFRLSELEGKARELDALPGSDAATANRA